MCEIVLNQVTYSYPSGQRAIDGISLTIPQGEAVAIVGRNGAGKTTAVKVMNGLLKPQAGSVTVDGMNTKEYTTAQIARRVGYVFQNPDDQIFHSDVYSEIEFGPNRLGLPPEKVKGNVMAAADLAGVADYLEENPYNLPYATRKFVTMAAVIAMDTSVIILDEPTAGQDVLAIRRIGSIIKALQEKGKTMITITHDMEFVAAHFERVIVMANAKVIADDHVRTIFWDFDILKQAMLKQPHISHLAHSVQVGHKIISINELIDQLRP